MAGGVRIETKGLDELVRALKGPAFKDVNRELRQHARRIATEALLPNVTDAVARSAAPQAAAMSQTVRVHSDRVPVVVVGKTNPKFGTGFARKGESAAQRRLRRGSLARGVVVGPLGGRRDTRASENYYRIGRDPSGGPLGVALRAGGSVMDAGRAAYLKAYMDTLRKHGFDADEVR